MKIVPLQSPTKGVTFDSVAQLVEQRPFKAWVLGSSPSGITSGTGLTRPVLFFPALFAVLTVLCNQGRIAFRNRNLR